MIAIALLSCLPDCDFQGVTGLIPREAIYEVRILVSFLHFL